MANKKSDRIASDAARFTWSLVPFFFRSLVGCLYLTTLWNSCDLSRLLKSLSEAAK